MLTALLFGVVALDELTAGIPALGAPDIQSSFALTYSAVTLFLLVIPSLVSLLLEPPLFVLADRYPRQWFVCGGLLLMGISAVAAGLAATPIVLTMALSGLYLGSGCGVGLSQAVLVDRYPEQRERVMTWWVFLAGLGDLAAPLLLVVLAFFELGWRTGFVLIGVVFASYAWLMSRQTFATPQTHADEDDVVPIRTAVIAALRDRKLLIWLFGCWLCDLLDEILLVFASLHLRDVVGVDMQIRTLILGCFIVGTLFGLMIANRLLKRWHPLRVLMASSAGCAVCYLAWLAVINPVTSAVLLLAVGMFSAPLYTIAKAQAYRALPGQSGMVNAVSHLFTPAAILLPAGLGLLAEWVGLWCALLVLVVQPLGLLVIACRMLRLEGHKII